MLNAITVIHLKTFKDMDRVFNSRSKLISSDASHIKRILFVIHLFMELDELTKTTPCLRMIVVITNAGPLIKIILAVDILLVQLLTS
ncbi:hypothetical protein CEXT_317051 [Caerostris extrusa]|uniref:Uncharacterized protein n=1 Tax=Caerostris extrusa TaxID=172846 RepID=A0AAV4NSP6_CAEEX|nr:hypothetical protein CEXT_317051 [Caerostris extrusa]